MNDGFYCHVLYPAYSLSVIDALVAIGIDLRIFSHMLLLISEHLFGAWLTQPVPHLGAGHVTHKFSRHLEQFMISRALLSDRRSAYFRHNQCPLIM